MQAGVPYSNGAAPSQIPTPGAAVRQTPFAMADTSDSQPGTSDMSGGTHASDGSWQQRPSIQGMALQVRQIDTSACFLHSKNQKCTSSKAIPFLKRHAKQSLCFLQHMEISLVLRQMF